MQFALNYSPQAAELLRQGRIAIDRFKCPPWPELVAAAQALRPVSLHFELRAGAPEPEPVDWAAIESWAQQTGTPTINLHLGARREDYPAIPHDSTDPAHREQITAALVRDVQAAVDVFGADRVIVENVPYHAEHGKILRTSVEADVIRQVVAETGCGLLLDISHGVISARYTGQDERAYLAALPVHRLRELHVTGIQHLNGRLTDHLGLGDTDWANFAWVLDQITSGHWATPWQVVFEYGGIGPLFDWRSDPAVIGAQVPRLVAMVQAATQRIEVATPGH
ncbi:MAG: hypothetical protein Kow0077_23560 [Anaerolineae bacterium]